MLLCSDENESVDLIELEAMLREYAETKKPDSHEERVLRDLQELVFNNTLTEVDVKDMIDRCKTSNGSIDFERLESQYRHIRDARTSIEEEEFHKAIAVAITRNRMNRN